MAGLVNNFATRSFREIADQALLFGKVTRRYVKVPTPMHSVNSPLYFHPEIIDEVLKFVFLPKEVAIAYRELADKNRNDAEHQAH